MITKTIRSFFEGEDYSTVSLPDILIEFSVAHKRLLAILSGIFCLMLFLKLHGYSFPVWHAYIDDSKPDEVLMGRLRDIRGDDFALDLPLFLSQLRNEPKFAVVNPHIGEGQNMIAPLRAPVWHFTSIFRPVCWGYFIGADYAMPWMWWSLCLGVFYSSFLLFMLISRNQFSLSCLSALTLVYSPFYQFWSFHVAEVAIHGIFIIVSLLCLLLSKSKKVILFNGLFLGWSAGCFILDYIYPPFQITMGYLIVFLSLAILLDRKQLLFIFKENKQIKVLSLITAFVIVSSGVFSFYYGAYEALRLVTETIYPGGRFSLGSGGTFWYFFNNLLYVAPKVGNWGALGNVCEASGFLFLFPLIYLVLFGDAWKEKKKLEPFPLLLLFYFIFLLFFYRFGFSEFIAKITFFYKVTSNRLMLGLGIAEMSLLTWYVSKPREKKFASFVAWAIWFIILAFDIKKRVVLPGYYFTIGLILSLTLGYLLILGRKQRIFVTYLFALNLIYTFSFNPVVRGGLDFIYSNPLSIKILELNKKSGAESKWATFIPFGAFPFGSYLRMLGVSSVDGYHGYPHKSIWKEIDPENKYTQVSNQSAYVTFIASTDLIPKVEGVSPGQIAVLTSPNANFFKRLKVNYLLVFDEKALPQFRSDSVFKEIYSYGNGTIFERTVLK